MYLLLYSVVKALWNCAVETANRFNYTFLLAQSLSEHNRFLAAFNKPLTFTF